MENLFIAFLVSVGLNILMFIPAYLFKTDKLTDISYALTFLLISIYGFVLSDMSLAMIVLLGMILLWSFRIGAYLLVRIHKMGKDSRFDDKRDKFFSFLGFWLIQGITVWVVLVPSIVFFNSESTSLSALSYLGVVIWGLGLSIETFADLQKFRFINNSENKGKWIENGLWRYSRHPNYFGEILVWLGVFLFTLSALSGIYILVGLISPLFITLMLIFVSGIPLLEKSADKRWGEDPKYQEYKRRTNVLVLGRVKR